MICKKCGVTLPDQAAYCFMCGAAQGVTPRARKRRGNGQGTVYKRGKTWTAYASHYENGHKYSKTKGGFEKKKDALDWLARVSFSVPKGSRTFKQIYDEWSALHYPSISEKKKHIYEWAYNKCGKLYGMKWEDIGLRHLQDVVNSAKETYYPRRDLKVLFSLMSQYAIVAGYSGTNYAPLIKLPPKEKPHKVPFSDTDIDALWNGYNSGDDFAGAILIMIYTGMRYGEISTIDPKNIHIEDSYLIGGIKTEAGKEGEILLLEEIKPIIKKLLIPENKLRAMSDTTFRKKFDATLKRFGCQEHTTHECRHTCATLLAKAGVQPAVIKEIMRHTSYAQTMEYTHIDRETKLAALKSITNKQPTENQKVP